MARTHRFSILDQPNTNVVGHKEVLGFLHVVEPTQVNFVKARQVVASVVKRVTS